MFIDSRNNQKPLYQVILMLNMKEAYELCKKVHPEKEITFGIEYPEAYGFEVMDERMHISDFTLDMTLVLKDTDEVIDTNIGNKLIIVPWYTKVYSPVELESL